MDESLIIYIFSGVMLVVAVAFLVYLLRGNDRMLPSGAFQWVVSGIAVLMVILSVALPVVTYRVEAGLMGTRDDGSPRIKSTEIDAPASDFQFLHVQSGEPGRLFDYQGDVVLVNFWATWCAPCLEELPALNRLQERYRDQGLTVLTISDERREALLDFEEDLPLRTVSAYLDNPSSLPQPFRRTLATRPTTYVIDREGTIRDFFLGARSFTAFEQVIRPYLETDASGARLVDNGTTR